MRPVRARMLIALPLCLAALIVLVPAASGAEPAERAKKTKVERQAETALRVARRARKIGRRALSQVAAATQAAAAAQADADAANSRLDSLGPTSDADAGSVTTGSNSQYVSLGGPSATVTVPASGLIEVWATVRFEDPADGQVALFEDGQLVPIPGQDGVCGNGTLDDVLVSAQFGSGQAITLSTPPAIIFGLGCGTAGAAPGPVLLERPPGTHTYELRYADCDCDPADAEFTDRTLRVAPRP